MNVKINSVHFDATEKLQDHITSRIDKLTTFDSTIMGAEVFLRLEKPQVTENKIVEIRMDLPGSELFAKKQCKTFEEATDLTVEALRRQLKRNKEKSRE